MKDNTQRDSAVLLSRRSSTCSRLTRLAAQAPLEFDLENAKPFSAYVDTPFSNWIAPRPLFNGREDPRRLNHQDVPLAIIGSYGMCQAGRVRHQLKHAVSEPDNAIVIVSYQAEGTLGRQLAEGQERVKLLFQWQDLNAAV